MKHSNFDALVQELDDLAKAQGIDNGDSDLDNEEDDRKIAAAAEEGAGDEPAVDDDGKPAEKKDEGEDDEPLGKSFTVTLENGDEVEAMDGTELVKSLMARVEGFDGQLAKALGVTVDNVKALKAELKAAGERAAKQDELIKSLQDSVDKIGDAGRGRKTTVSVHEKPAGNGGEPQPEGVEPKEFMAKAMEQFNAGKLTGQNISSIEAHINRGLAPPADLVRKVIG
ncbi:MAG TPA: hypothetical protein VFM97_00125 [Gammaproteobacteria bacterium]|nr:hypothetical protein [Gammaproteobacteria bacterium]